MLHFLQVFHKRVSCPYQAFVPGMLRVDTTPLVLRCTARVRQCYGHLECWILVVDAMDTSSLRGLVEVSEGSRSRGTDGLCNGI